MEKSERRLTDPHGGTDPRAGVENLQPRDATVRDHETFARLFAELGVDDPTPDAARWGREIAPHAFFLEGPGGPVAYTYVEPLADVGYIRHVVVAPDWRGRGVGRRVMGEIASRLRSCGCTRWCLNVKDDNEPAIRLYRRLGLSEAYATIVLRLDWDRVAALPELPETLEVRPFGAAEDAELERAFGLPGGQLARLRRSEANVLRCAREAGGRPVALARFDPGFPGCFPFRAHGPAVARALLEALRPLAQPEDEWIQLVIEDDADLADALLVAGARRRYRILHMQGEVPAP